MNPQQQAVFRRKVMYFAAILGLFTLSMFWRGTLDIPFSKARAGEPPVSFTDRVAARTIVNQATSLQLRELDEGEQEIEGSAARLALVGSRGIVVAYLWHSAIDKQKRNDFHKMDSLVQTVTQLQPHFITPWIFQSWNITYNVSVEMQGSGDMYYYIARGIELLAEGERRQGRVEPDGRRIGSPDMRYQLAFYYQNKFGVSDTVEVLRCLFALSCISPDERNPDAGGLTNADGSVNMDEFRKFCEKYPHLVRRLRGENQQATKGDDATKRKALEALKCPKPEDIIRFLRENRDVPTRFKFAQELKDADKQFPVLPPKFNEGPDEAHPGMETKDDFTAFKASRAWYIYSMVPLPANPQDAEGNWLPSSTPSTSEYDPVRYRIPRSPMLIIFRQGAPRVQTYQAEMEQKEGWYDDEGWRVGWPTDWRDRKDWTPEKRKAADFWWAVEGGDNQWFPGQDVVIGRERPWSGEEWRKAATMWRDHGNRYGLVLDTARAERYTKAANDRPRNPTPEQLDDPKFLTVFRTASAMYWYEQNRQVTNFAYFLASSEAEQKGATVVARKTLWLAEQARKVGEKPIAVRFFEEGLRQWRDVLAENKEFHRPDRSTRTEEDSYTYELTYQQLLVRGDERVNAKATAMANALNNLKGLQYPLNLMVPPTAQRDLQQEFRWHIAETDPAFSPLVGVMNVNDNRNGTPWVQPYLKESVRMTANVQRRPPAPPGANLPQGAPPLPGMPNPTPAPAP